MKDDFLVIFKDDVQKIFDSFSSAFDLKILFYTPGGQIIKVGLNRPNALYCQLIQDRLFGINKCLEKDREIREKARTIGESVSHYCHAGVKNVISPIFDGASLLGYIGYGQFRQTGHLPRSVRTSWVRKGEDLAEIKEAFLQLPFYSKEKEKNIKELFSHLLDYIISQHMISSKGDLILQKALSYIYAHIQETIRLKDVAKAVGRSRSTVSHLFKDKTKSGFKKTVLNIKFDKAEEYFRTSPYLKIKEVAERIGYEDALHFSRIYRKHRKISPRQFIRDLNR